MATYDCSLIKLITWNNLKITAITSYTDIKIFTIEYSIANVRVVSFLFFKLLFLLFESETFASWMWFQDLKK